MKKLIELLQSIASAIELILQQSISQNAKLAQIEEDLSNIKRNLDVE